jgi:phage baseplate assembly protein W
MTVHRLTTTDSLQGLAARYLGSHTRWREIAEANELRPPYISSDPIDQFGALLASYALVGPVLAGARSFTLSGADAAFVRAGARLYLRHGTPSGASWSDVATVASYDSAAISLLDPLSNGYVAGVALLVFAPLGELAGRVAQPGDTLVIPGTTGGAATSIFAVDDRFGRDLSTDAAGRLLLSTEGDLVIVGGKENLIQQLRNRLRCERGAMVRHPDYGCNAHAYVGAVNGPTLAVLLQSALSLALSNDSRVGSVEQVGVAIDGEAIDVSARVLALNEAVDLAIVVGR